MAYRTYIFSMVLVITFSFLPIKASRVRRQEGNLEHPAWTSPKAEVTTPQEFIDEALKVHNEYRKLHHVPDLVLNDELSQISQAYANKLAASATDLPDHNEDAIKDELGENLYYYRTNKAGKKPTAQKSVKTWYNEVNDYDFKKGDGIDDKDVLHFTQIVWKETTQLGIAYATTPEANADGYYLSFIVANYYPRANWGDPLLNVFPIDLSTIPQRPAATPGGSSGDPLSPTGNPSDLTAATSVSGEALPKDKRNCKSISTFLSPVISLTMGCILFLAYI